MNTKQVKQLKQHVFWVDPACIEFYAPKSSFPYIKEKNDNLQRYPRFIANFLNTRIEKNVPFVFDRHTFATEVVPVQDVLRYKLVKNLLDQKLQYHYSDWYELLEKQLQQKGYAKHKKIIMKTLDEINGFFDGYVTPLYLSLINEGFKVDSIHNVAKVYIGPAGQMLKGESGFHRFAIARESGLKSMPVRVEGVHSEYLKNFAPNVNSQEFEKSLRLSIEGCLKR
ncbi:hypothetical protein [Thiomicrospira sp. ALE5]|uniref:hypothetical protein n=1 Tax=Thiomicrospira sp. ALE5 TaxID=748650 RepID=UPI0008F00554|nr:hypothetical protein [Thiomicrospira sp. ALE5]SFR49119.1 hypothetical protein SAMN03092900_0096 [Thiomicrospira sp. ALE5]